LTVTEPLPHDTSRMDFLEGYHEKWQAH